MKIMCDPLLLSILYILTENPVMWFVFRWIVNTGIDMGSAMNSEWLFQTLLDQNGVQWL